MIIQTGQRTDIPAFYSEWFANRLKAGFVLVRNPCRPQIVTRYRLTPDVVDLIGFCTKNPAPMLGRLDLLRPFGQYWQVTVTPYGKDIEPNVPNKLRVLDSFRRLSDAVGVRRVAWRYDPILISGDWPVDRHIRAFAYMAKELSGYTRTAVISFIDLYEKTRRNFPQARPVREEDRLTLGKALVEIGREYGMTVRPCAEGDELARFGADCSGCMTAALLEEALGRRLRVPRLRPVRKECACLLGGDIGAYNTCGHFCRYCYANTDPETVAANMKQHDPGSPLLIGHLLPGEEVRGAEQESWIDPQMNLLDL